MAISDCPMKKQIWMGKSAGGLPFQILLPAVWFWWVIQLGQRNLTTVHIDKLFIIANLSSAVPPLPASQSTCDRSIKIYKFCHKCERTNRSTLPFYM
uniref:Uncharacterized protein n=1 Tax=Hottentotta judaicus TaxID=6863 RepID=F1CJ07_HOTJU|nr:hypothetical protein [Hottentotta judaicus]